MSIIDPTEANKKKLVGRSKSAELTGTLTDVIQHLTELAEEIREEGVEPSNVSVDIQGGCDYCDGYFEGEVYYRRMETDAEHVARIQRQMEME